MRLGALGGWIKGLGTGLDVWVAGSDVSGAGSELSVAGLRIGALVLSVFFVTFVFLFSRSLCVAVHGE